MLDEAIRHTAVSFGDAVDRMINKYLYEKDITPTMDGALQIGIEPPEEGTRTGWEFTLIYKGEPVGCFEIGLFVTEKELTPQQ